MIFKKVKNIYLQIRTYFDFELPDKNIRFFQFANLKP